MSGKPAILDTRTSDFMKSIPIGTAFLHSSDIDIAW